MSNLTDYRPTCIPLSLIRHTFIDTGVADGVTMCYAVKQPFRRLCGIDVCKRVLDTAVDRLWSLSGREVERLHIAGDDCRIEFDGKMVELRLGSSPDLLRAMLNPEESTTCWLDAHWQHAGDDEMAPQHGQCPLLYELEVVRTMAWRERPILCIDDAAIFCTNWWWDQPWSQGFHRSEWPTFEQIVDALGQEWNYTVSGGIIYCW